MEDKYAASRIARNAPARPETPQNHNVPAGREPSWETLETRLMLSTYHVSTAADPLEDGSAAHPFDSIQQAIDAAGDGDTVEVAPGLYTGDLLIAHRDFTLVSTGGSAVTGIQFVDGVGLEISANNVHIGTSSGGGFTFHDASATTTLIALADSTSQLAVFASAFDTGAGASAAIDLGSNAAGAELSGNMFATEGGDVAVRGQDVLDGTIRGNRFTGPGGGTIGTGIELTGAEAGTDIVGNIFEGYSVGLAIHAGEGVFATIQGNYFLACGVGLYFGNQGDGGGVYSVGVYGNYFLGDATGLLVEAGANVVASSIHVYQGNSFSQNTIAIQNNNALVLPVGPRVGNSILTVGTPNWFGHSSGPKAAANPKGRGGAVVGPVDFYGKSWLKSPPAMVLPNVSTAFAGNDITAIPGDTVQVPFTFTNLNAFAVTGQVELTLYMSDDATLDGADTLFQTATFTLTLGANAEATRQLALTIDGGYSPGSKYILAVANEGTINEDAVPYYKPIEVVWKFGRVGDHRNAVLNLGGVRYSTSGGTGTVSPTGTAGVVDILLENTTRRSSVKITELSAEGGWNIRNIESQAALGRLTASRTAVLGDMDFYGGLSALTVESVTGDSEHMLVIEPGKGAVSLSLGAVTDLWIASDMPIRTLTVAQWLKTGNRINRINTSSLGTLYSAGDFMADFGQPGGEEVSLGRATIGASSQSDGAGGLNNASWYLTGNVESIVLAKAYSCSIMVDVGDTVVGLPATASDFDADARIGKVTIGSMTDARVAASALGSVRVRRGPALENEVIGITTRSLQTLVYENNSGRINLSRLTWPGQSYQDGEFVVRIV